MNNDSFMVEPYDDDEAVDKEYDDSFDDFKDYMCDCPFCNPTDDDEFDAYTEEGIGYDEDDDESN